MISIYNIAHGRILFSLLICLLSSAGRAAGNYESAAVIEQLGVAQQSSAKVLHNAAEVGKQARGGDTEAQYQLALCYHTGSGCPRNLVAAVYWYQEAAQKGHGLAANNLGLSYAEGLGGLARDNEKAVYWLKEAVKAGESTAELNLYVHYANGWGVVKDMTTALTYLLSAANKNEATAQIELARRLFDGEGLGKNEEEGIRWLLKATEQGNEIAPYVLAEHYLNKVKPDYQNAHRYYRVAADRANPIAIGKLGYLLVMGKGVIQDQKAGIELLQRASTSGDLASKRHLAAFYDKGIGVTASQFDAARLYREAGLFGDEDALDQARRIHNTGYPEETFFKDLLAWNIDRANQNMVSAKLALVVLYRDGLAGVTDLTQSYHWLQSAAVQGNRKAQYWLGLVLEEGKWITKDDNAAFEWFLKAARQSVIPARFKVGRAYALGIGVKKDEKQAMKWLRLAASDGINDAYQLMDKIEKAKAVTVQSN